MVMLVNKFRTICCPFMKIWLFNNTGITRASHFVVVCMRPANQLKPFLQQSCYNFSNTEQKNTCQFKWTEKRKICQFHFCPEICGNEHHLRSICWELKVNKQLNDSASIYLIHFNLCIPNGESERWYKWQFKLHYLCNLDRSTVDWLCSGIKWNPCIYIIKQFQPGHVSHVCMLLQSTPRRITTSSLTPPLTGDPSPRPPGPPAEVRLTTVLTKPFFSYHFIMGLII